MDLQPDRNPTPAGETPRTSAASIVREPLYQRIKREVVAGIAGGELAAGDALPTRAELASRYGTTRATVDRALQELAREGVVTAGSGRRTQVAAATPRPAAIAVVWDWTDEENQGAGDFLDPLFGGIRLACARSAVEVHYRTEFTSLQDVLVQTRAQGLLVLRPGYGDAPQLARLRRAGVPVVSVHAVIEDDVTPSIASDNRAGVDAAVGHLADLGHTQIGLVSLTSVVPDHFERLQGYLEAMGRRGLAVNPAWLAVSHTSHPRLYTERAAQHLDPLRLPTALVVSDFGQCWGVLDRLATLGATIPRDISVVSFDDPPLAAHLSPALTVVRQDVAGLGQRAVEMLLAIIRGERVPTVVRVPAQLVVRESTGPPRTGASPTRP